SGNQFDERLLLHQGILHRLQLLCINAVAAEDGDLPTLDRIAGLSWLSAGDERSFAFGRKGADGVGAEGVGFSGVPIGAISIPVCADTAANGSAMLTRSSFHVVTNLLA